MPRKKPTKDVNQWAAALVEMTENRDEPVKNPAAVSLGRLGGLKGGIARDKALSSKRKSEIARKAAKARWSKHERDILAAVRKGVTPDEVSKKLGVKVKPYEVLKRLRQPKKATQPVP